MEQTPEQSSRRHDGARSRSGKNKNIKAGGGLDFFFTPLRPEAGNPKKGKHLKGLSALARRKGIQSLGHAGIAMSADVHET